MQESLEMLIVPIFMLGYFFWSEIKMKITHYYAREGFLPQQININQKPLYFTKQFLSKESGMVFREANNLFYTPSFHNAFEKLEERKIPITIIHGNRFYKDDSKEFSTFELCFQVSEDDVPLLFIELDLDWENSFSILTLNVYCKYSLEEISDPALKKFLSIINF